MLKHKLRVVHASLLDTSGHEKRQYIVASDFTPTRFFMQIEGSPGIYICRPDDHYHYMCKKNIVVVTGFRVIVALFNHDIGINDQYLLYRLGIGKRTKCIEYG